MGTLHTPLQSIGFWLIGLDDLAAHNFAACLGCCPKIITKKGCHVIILYLF
jgi:hypothetical protein